MLSFVLVGIGSGLLFAAMDGLFNASPYAMKIYRFYAPIAREQVNFIAGSVIDLLYGFALAGIFLLLYNGFPTDIGVVKGLCYGLIAWFFRVVMMAATQWMIIDIPVSSLLYMLFTGLIEMLVLGTLYGLTLKPF